MLRSAGTNGPGSFYETVLEIIIFFIIFIFKLTGRRQGKTDMGNPTTLN